jgi:hypothetical protein
VTPPTCMDDCNNCMPSLPMLALPHEPHTTGKCTHHPAPHLCPLGASTGERPVRDLYTDSPSRPRDPSDPACTPHPAPGMMGQPDPAPQPTDNPMKQLSPAQPGLAHVYQSRLESKWLDWNTYLPPLTYVGAY